MTNRKHDDIVASSQNHRLAVGLLRKLPSLLPWRHKPCPNCHLYVRFTGEAPRNQIEELIKKVAGNREAAPFHWLEKQLGEALYRSEMQRAGWAVDIGLWGPHFFQREATRILSDLHPRFGYLAPEDKHIGMAH